MSDPAAASLESSAEFMDKFSRQIAVFGLETMGALIKLKVLIVGVKGVGVEIAKNLILAGPKAVTLADDGLAVPADLGTNFFLSAASVGQPRAAASLPQLQDLNKTVDVVVHSGSITHELIAAHNVVVFTQGTLEELLQWNSFTRSHAIGFIAVHIRGMAGQLFSDFGTDFVARDLAGEVPKTRVIDNIDIDNETGKAFVRLVDEKGHLPFVVSESDNDGWISFSGIEGCGALDEEAAKLLGGPSLNGAGPFRCRIAQKPRTSNGKTTMVTDMYAMVVEGLPRLTPYIKNGVVTQVLRPVVLKFQSLEARLENPVKNDLGCIQFNDCSKIGGPESLFFAAKAVWKFEAEQKRLPTPNSEEDAEAVLAIAKQLAEAAAAAGSFSAELLDGTIKSYAKYAALEFQPLCAFFGGVVAQEVVKFTGKFTPTDGWMFHDCFEALPSPSPAPAELVAPGSRYDHIVQIFGTPFLEKLLNSKTFMVGCGALGCELLKDFALLGVGCGPAGRITVTDNDRIEVSNLNRQFLFREKNVGQAKSLAASHAAKAMNPSLNVVALETIVEPKTENVFTSEFWRAQDWITNALDNVKARLYVDHQCVLYGKPLLESGTLGAKCNVQVVVPHITQSYSDIPLENEDEALPMCTIRNTPSLIEHCIEWARAKFNDLFVEPFKGLQKLATNVEGFLVDLRADAGSTALAIRGKLPSFRLLRDIAKAAATHSFEGCVAFAVQIFYSFFNDALLRLLIAFPADKLDTQGRLYWSGSRRLPTPTSLDLSNAEHLHFILAVTNILGFGVGLHPDCEVALDHPWRNVDSIKAVASKVEVSPFDPATASMSLDEDEGEEAKGGVKSAVDLGPVRAELEAILAELGDPALVARLAGVTFQVADFEKDHDANFHIDFVASAANVRAGNYGIEPAPRHKAKMIAGKIIPAIATTTAAVCGLVCVELVKVLQHKPIEALRDSSNSLSVNSYSLFEPSPPKKAHGYYSDIYLDDVIATPDGFTKWDQTVITGNLTLRDFLATYTEQTGLTVMALRHPSADVPKQANSSLFLYRAGLAEFEAKLDTNLYELVQATYPDPVVFDGSDVIELNCECDDDEHRPHIVPTLLYRFRSFDSVA